MIIPEYEAQRLERLKELVCEYLDDSDNTATKFLDDLQVALLKGKQYFQGRVDEYNQIMEFFQ
jgi:hypothetical protein